MTEVDVVTVLLDTENVADVAPCAIVTEAGTVAAAVFELERATTAPPDPAADVSVTVPVADCPPTTVAGLTEMPLRLGGGGFTVRPNVSLTPA